MLSKFAQAKWRWGVLGLALVLAAAVFGVIALTGGGDRAQAQQQQFHGASIQKVCAGPNGNAAVPRAREGDTVTCTIRVTNIDDFGDALTINSIVDVVHHRSGDVSTGNLLAAPVVLAAKGDSVERLHTYVVAVADNDPLFDDATTNGTDPVVGSFTLTFPGKVEIIHPHTTLTKTASPTSGRSPLPVTYTYKETNDGDDPITGVTLTDNKCSPLARQPDAPGNNDNILGVGETWVFTCSMTLTATTTNVVTASGTASDGLPAPAERAEATVTVIRPETTLTKTASPTSGRSPLPVTYTYREKNTGDVPITGVTLTDNKCSPLARQPDAPGNNDNILDVGETWVFTCSVTLTATTTNVVTASGTASDGLPAPAERAEATVTVIRPETTLTKTASPTSGTAPLAVTYTYREKNTGDDPITGVALTDDKCAPVARGADDPGNNDNILDVGETWVFTCSTTLNETTTNVVTATGTDSLGGAVPERATATVVVTPPAVGRMTGGGSVFKIDGARVTRGFEIHCDLREPNNIEVNWPGGNNFHMTSLTAAVCTEDPAIIQKPPAAPFDTFTGEGTGKLNGETGATIHFVFVDAGEPGKSDTALIQIWDAAGNLVLEVSGFIDVGNLQAHKD